MKKIVYIVLCTLVLWGCKNEDSKRSYWSEKMEPQQVEIVRFDKALLKAQEGHLEDNVRALYENFPEFMPFWVESMLGSPSSDTTYLLEALPKYLNDTIYGFKRTNQLEQELFADISDIQTSLNKAFTRIKYLYPQYQVPVIYLMPSIFVTNLYATPDFIAVGADMYLGSDYDVYDKWKVVYDYQKQGMRKECIPVDVLRVYITYTLPDSISDSRLLDQMIQRGKLMYLMAQILDELPGYEVMGWTKEQWDWSIRYEANIWHKIMDQQALYKRDNLLISHYLNEAPFTTEIVSDETDQDSPGRLGIWIGWRIVERYMEHHPEVTLQELMAEPDAQKILKLSLYQP